MSVKKTIKYLMIHIKPPRDPLFGSYILIETLKVCPKPEKRLKNEKCIFTIFLFENQYSGSSNII